MEYKARINWKRHDTAFDTKSYARTHYIYFGGGVAIEASSAPEFLGNAELPNPEELFVSSISSCFMLTFLYWAATRNIIINEYSAEAVGKLTKNSEGKMAITEVTIKPSIAFHEDRQPESSVLNDLFKKAHDNCFISNSVKSKITIQSEAIIS